MTDDVAETSQLELTQNMTRLYLSDLMDSGKAAELRASVTALKAFINIQLVDENSKHIICSTLRLLIISFEGSKRYDFINYDTIYHFSENTNVVRGHMRPTNKLHQAVDVVRRFMDQMGYGLYDGSVYRKPDDTKFTYIHCSDVHNFIHHILGNSEIADAIVSYVSPIINLLSVKSCRLIPPIKIDFNFVEVLPQGTCFDIRNKCFKVDPSDLKGINSLTRCIVFCLMSIVYVTQKRNLLSLFSGSPRAFVRYVYDGTVPYPEQFVKGKTIFI